MVEREICISYYKKANELNMLVKKSIDKYMQFTKDTPKHIRYKG